MLAHFSKSINWLQAFRFFCSSFPIVYAVNIKRLFCELMYGMVISSMLDREIYVNLDICTIWKCSMFGSSVGCVKWFFLALTVGPIIETGKNMFSIIFVVWELRACSSSMVILITCLSKLVSGNVTINMKISEVVLP